MCIYSFKLKHLNTYKNKIIFIFLLSKQRNTSPFVFIKTQAFSFSLVFVDKRSHLVCRGLGCEKWQSRKLDLFSSYSVCYLTAE